MLFKKKQVEVDPRIKERDNLFYAIHHARDVLSSRVESVLANNLMLTVLPVESIEYKNCNYELTMAKQDVIEWMHSYECCIDDLREFAKMHPDLNVRTDHFNSAEQTVRFICRYYYRK